jgi:hypothetical protein
MDFQGVRAGKRFTNNRAHREHSLAKGELNILSELP